MFTSYCSETKCVIKETLKGEINLFCVGVMYVIFSKTINFLIAGNDYLFAVTTGSVQPFETFVKVVSISMLLFSAS